nr:hypothetical protein [Tanacetum cinerariifolium]
TNVVNASREPFVVKQDHGVNSPHIDECCCECGEALDGIICQQCACKSCGKGAHIGYNCPPKVPIISNPKPCNQTMNNQPPQTLLSFDLTCAKCGHPVNGPYCQGCALLREKLEEDLISYFQNFQNISESSDDSTNIVNAPREPFVVKKDHGVNPPHIDECCCECGNALDGIYCQQCICKSCGKGAHTGYNYPPKVLIISNPEPCNQTMNNELPQTSPSFHPTCYSDKENSVPCVSKPNFVDESFDIFNPPPQPPIYSCEFYGSNVNMVTLYTSSSVYQSGAGLQSRLEFPAKYSRFSTTCQPPQYTVNHPIFNAHNDFLNSQNELSIAQNMIMEQMKTLTSMCELVCQIFQKKQEEKRIEEEQAAKARYWKIPACCNDDDDYDSAITPVLSTEETENSLSMGDEHLDTIPVTESDEVINSSVEDLVPIPSESKGIPDTIDDDSLYNENIEYVEASPHDSELVSLEAAEIVILEEEEIEDDNLREKLLNVHLLIVNIEALKDNLTPSSKSLTKSSSISPKSFLDETNTFYNSLPEFKNFCFDLEEISSGNTTTHSDISLPDYEAFYFYDDHIEEISSGSTTTHSDISLSEYDSFIFDFTHEEFADELTHIISPPEYDRFYFLNLPYLGELMFILNSKIRENSSSTTRVNLPIKDDHSPLLAYVVWIFLAYLTYLVIPPYLHSFGNEDTIFDPGITINRVYSFKPGLSHRYGAFKKLNTHRSHLNEWPMIINGKNIPNLDVLLFYFYPP